jgi:hypothetical protein
MAITNILFIYLIMAYLMKLSVSQTENVDR